MAEYVAHTGSMAELKPEYMEPVESEQSAENSQQKSGNSQQQEERNMPKESEDMVISPLSAPVKTGGISSRFTTGAKPGPGRPKRMTPTVMLNEKVPDIFIIQGYLDAIEIAREQKSAGRMVQALDSLADRKWGPPTPADDEPVNALEAILVALRTSRITPE